MKFLVYSQINKSDVGAKLGRPEYSYYFVLEPFLPVLAKLGEVIVVHHPETEVDATFDEYTLAGERCIFICFSPPNKSIIGLRCPTVTVFAWEFDRLPNEVWDDDPRNDWSYVLRQQGWAITLSSDSARVVRGALGDTFDVMAIPVPVYDRFSPGLGDRSARSPTLAARRFTFAGVAFDSGYYEITADSFSNTTPANRFGLPLWNGQTIELDFSIGNAGVGSLGGFYEAEPWGTWSKLGQPWLIMPALLHGKFSLHLDVVGYGSNIGRSIHVIVGNDRQSLVLDNDMSTHELVFNVEEPQALIHLAGLDVSAIPGAADPRTMGIGMRSLRIESIDMASASHSSTSASALMLELKGVVYTSVLNPGDDRKNWIDMLKAFCWAFRDIEDATLVLKMTHHSIGAFLGVFHYHMLRIGPVKCRVVLLHGYLDSEQFKQLIDVSTYYVNSSRCEGLCLPLMEFMSSGVPAVAPCNTAMADYVTEDSVFVVRSSREPGIWPHDPRTLLRTLRYRIDWSSLVEQLKRSYVVATSEPSRYRQMSSAASAVQRDFCSEAVVANKLRQFFRCE